MLLAVNIRQSQSPPCTLCQNNINVNKEDIIFSREISLKVICEKVKFTNCDFCNNFLDYEWTRT